MSKSTKVIAGLGVVAALGVAALPVASFAATDPQQVTLTVTIQETNDFAIDANTKSATMAANATNTSMSSTVTVSSNNANGYTVTVADVDANNALVSSTSSIPAIATPGAIEAGTAAWGIKAAAAYAGSDLDTTDYKAVPVSTDTAAKVVAKTSLAGLDNAVQYEIDYGVATSADQASGNYTDTIVYTYTPGQGA